MIALGDNGLGATEASLAGVLPFTGACLLLAYRQIARDPVPLFPFVVYGVGSVAFAVSMLDLSVDLDRDPDGSYIPVLQYGIGLLLPFAAFVGGLASLAASALRQGRN